MKSNKNMLFRASLSENLLCGIIILPEIFVLLDILTIFSFIIYEYRLN